MLIRSLTAFALILGSLFAGPIESLRAQVECHDGLMHIPVDVESIGGGRCGSTAVTVSAVQVHAGGNACPRMAIVTPGHTIRTSQPGSNVRAVLQGVIPGLIFTYECRTTRLLWLLPLFAECVETGHHTSGGFNHYSAIACP